VAERVCQHCNSLDINTLCDHCQTTHAASSLVDPPP
jgi:hypothetical protein